MFKLQEYIKSSNSVNGTLIQLLTSKECKLIVLFSLKVQTCAPATHVCMAQRAPTFWMVTLAHAQHISQAYGARFLSVSRLIHRWKLLQLSLCTTPLPSGKIREFSRGEGGEGSVHRLLQLSLERNHLHYNAFVELYTTRKNYGVGTIQLRLDLLIILDSGLPFI